MEVELGRMLREMRGEGKIGSLGSSIHSAGTMGL